MQFNKYTHTHTHYTHTHTNNGGEDTLRQFHPRLKNKALLLDTIIVNLCAGSNLGNAARHEYRGSFPATYSLLPLAKSTCGEVGSDVHALIKELTIRRGEHRSKTHSNESQHLAEGTEVAPLRRRFSFVLQQALSFRTRHHLCRQGVALASTRQLRSQGPVSVHAHRTESATWSEGREGANGVGGRVGVGGGNGDGNGVGGGNGDVNGHGDGDGVGAGTRVEASEGAKDENGTGAETGWERGREWGWRPVDGPRMGTGTGARTGRKRERGRRRVDEHRMGTATGTRTKK